MAEPGLPDLRASDADRERAVERLRAAAADGQLTVDELDERLQLAYAARTQGELVPLTADLQAHGVARTAASGVRVAPGQGGARWLIAVMGGGDRRGRWRLGPRVTSINLMGGADLDLNDAEFAAEHVELTVWSIMGGANIRVPEGLAVEVSEFAFMGGNRVDVGAHAAGGPGPVLHLRLYSLMGGTDVKRGRKTPRRRRHGRHQLHG